MIENEVWMPIEKYPEYEISNLKRVRSTYRVLTSITGYEYVVREKILKQFKDVAGNNQIIIGKNNRKIYLLIDILYYQAFVSKKQSN